MSIERADMRHATTVLAIISAMVAKVTEAVGPAQGCDDADDERVTGGVKEAIQDLYAEIKAYETGSGGGRCLDDATSTKAKYVSDSLRRMADGGGRRAGPAGKDAKPTGKDAAKPAAGKDVAVTGGNDGGGGDGDDGDGRRRAAERLVREQQKRVVSSLSRFDATLAAEVDKLMDKCVEIKLVGNVCGGRAEDGAGLIAVDAVESLERGFRAVLGELERLKKRASAAATSASVVVHTRSSGQKPKHIFTLFNKRRVS